MTVTKKKPAAPVIVPPHFITGQLGADLAAQHEKTMAALKAAKHKPAKKPCTTQMFETNALTRQQLASFVETESHKPIIWDFERFQQSSRPKKVMDEETKAYLKEKGAARRMLRPKRATGFTLQQACAELGIEPSDARKVLRKSKVEKPQGGWSWTTEDEAMAVLKGAGIVKGVNTPAAAKKVRVEAGRKEAKVQADGKQPPAKRMSPAAAVEASKKNSAAIQGKPTKPKLVKRHTLKRSKK